MLEQHFITATTNTRHSAIQVSILLQPAGRISLKAQVPAARLKACLAMKAKLKACALFLTVTFINLDGVLLFPNELVEFKDSASVSGRERVAVILWQLRKLRFSHFSDAAKQFDSEKYRSASATFCCAMRLRGAGKPISTTIGKVKARDLKLKKIRKAHIAKARYKAGTVEFLPFVGPHLYALGGRSTNIELRFRPRLPEPARFHRALISVPPAAASCIASTFARGSGPSSLPRRRSTGAPRRRRAPAECRCRAPPSPP
jgi:hypothetical protein